MQRTASPSVGVAASARKIVYSFPRITIGVLRPPKSFRVHAKLLPLPPSGLIESGSPVSRLMLLYSGPRQYVQSSGSAADELLNKTLVQTSNAMVPCKVTSRKRFMMNSRVWQAGEVKRRSPRSHSGTYEQRTTRGGREITRYATAPDHASCRPPRALNPYSKSICRRPDSCLLTPDSC